MLGNNGNFELNGEGGVNLDYQSQGDCANVYVFDGSVAVGYVRDGDTIVGTSVFNANQFLLPDSPHGTVPTETTPEYDIYHSGSICMPDSGIGLEITWWTPRAPGDTSDFAVCGVQVYTYGGEPQSDVSIALATDWDIPSDYGSDNEAGHDAGYRMVYQRGIGWGCQDNSDRYGAQAYIGYRKHGECGIKSVDPANAFTEDNQLYVWPQSGFIPEELYLLMQRSGYDHYGGITDQHAITTFTNSLDLYPVDTLSFYVALVTIREGSIYQLRNAVTRAFAWFDDHVASMRVAVQKARAKQLV
jgi:hypothetical protein